MPPFGRYFEGRTELFFVIRPEDFQTLPSVFSFPRTKRPARAPFEAFPFPGLDDSWHLEVSSGPHLRFFGPRLWRFPSPEAALEHPQALGCRLPDDGVKRSSHDRSLQHSQSEALGPAVSILPQIPFASLPMPVFFRLRGSVLQSAGRFHQPTQEKAVHHGFFRPPLFQDLVSPVNRLVAGFLLHRRISLFPSVPIPVYEAFQILPGYARVLLWRSGCISQYR